MGGNIARELKGFERGNSVKDAVNVNINIKEIMRFFMNTSVITEVLTKKRSFIQ